MNCLICGLEFKGVLVLFYTDRNGEVACGRCGVPYLSSGINVQDEYVPFVKKYWEQFGRELDLGTYIPIARNQVKFDNQDAFYTWLADQEDAPKGWMEV